MFRGQQQHRENRTTTNFLRGSSRSSESEMEYDVPFNPGAQEYHVILEGFPHHTHFKQIYKEFRKIGIEKLKVDVVSNYKPNPTLAIVTFDCEESVREALKWDGKDFNFQPMYIRRLDTNNRHDMEMLNIVLHGKRNEEFNDEVRNQIYGERTVNISAPRGSRGASYGNYHNQGYDSHRGAHRGSPRGRGQQRQYSNDQYYGSNYGRHPHQVGQGDFSHHHTGNRGASHTASHSTARLYHGRGSSRAPAPHQRPSFGHPNSVGNPRFRGSSPVGGARGPFQRGMPYSRGRGYRGGHNQQTFQPNEPSDPFEPTEEDISVSGQLQEMLDDCFPEGCLPWMAKDLPERTEAHIAEVINEKYFFVHVTNGLPGIEIKELTRKMSDKAFHDGAEAYTDPQVRRCAALYSDDPAEQPPELFRAWIRELSEDGQCEVFFIDWGNSIKESYSNLSVIKDIHWTMRPQIVLFKMSDTSNLQRGLKATFRVLTKNVYEKNYVVPVELAESE